MERAGIAASCGAGRTCQGTRNGARDPQVDPLYHTVVHIGSENAKGIGGTDERPVVTKAWGEFTDRDVDRMDGDQLRFWYGDQPGASDTAGLIAGANGDCRAWSRLFEDVLAAQGIGSTERNVTAITANEWMMLKQFQYTGTTTPGHGVYIYKIGVDAGPSDTLDAQGNADPMAAWENHYVVTYDIDDNGVENVYDPSFGTGPFDDLGAWENASLEGFAIKDAGIYYMRKNDPSTLETKFD